MLTSRNLVAFAVVVLGASLALAQSSTGSAPIEYKAGQVWRVTGGDEIITVLKVEDLPKLGHVIHVRVSNIHVPACTGLHLTRDIDHIATNEKMLRKSTSTLMRENEQLPDSYLDGYRLWQAQSKPKVVKDTPISDIIRKTGDYPLICNFLPAETA